MFWSTKSSFLQQWQCQLPELEFLLRHIQVSIATADPLPDAAQPYFGNTSEYLNPLFEDDVDI